jgi:hypothetical protein
MSGKPRWSSRFSVFPRPDKLKLELQQPPRTIVRLSKWVAVLTARPPSTKPDHWPHHLEPFDIQTCIRNEDEYAPKRYLKTETFRLTPGDY